MEFFKEILGKIWYILYPFLFYYAVMLIIMTIAQWAFGGDATHYVFCQLIATVFTIPSMLPFYRQGQALAGIAKQPLGISRERICHALFAAGIMACLGISLNNLILPLLHYEGWRGLSMSSRERDRRSRPPLQRP